MRSFYLSCPVCTSLDHEAIVPSFHGDTLTPLQTIGICRNCGMVYRNPHVPELSTTSYLAPEHWGNETPPFAERFTRVVDRVKEQSPLNVGDRFLDIGAGPGWLARRLILAFPGAVPVLLEPSVKWRHSRRACFRTR